VRNIAERLRDIQEAITRIEKYSQQGRASFDQNELIQTWVIHHLEIIGEAARSLPQDFCHAHPEIPWSQISGMRNILIHMYFGIDPDVVWAVVERDLPSLKRSIETILKEESS
jgi:uncharacterized protein with HEPN domain